MHTPLISVAELQALQRGGAPLLVFDCSFDLMNPPAGHAAFLQGHIPGARHADLDRDLSAKGAADAASGGRHPLPSRAAFARWAADQGLGPHTQAVVYDRNGCNYCGRLWWMLKWLGHEAVAVLDGGWQAWTGAGGAVANGEADPVSAPCDAVLASPWVKLATTADVAARVGQPEQTLIDARGAPRFKGEVEPLDPVAGHIPGALNRPFTANFQADGRFKSAADLRAEFDALLAGRDPRSVVHHCGSGVSAVPNLIAMELAGLGRQALYAGSWSEWCHTPGLPCARG